MDNIIGKTTKFIIKLAFILSLAGMLASWAGTVLINYLPQIEVYTGLSFGDLTWLSGILTFASVSSGFALKMSGVVNSINRTHTSYVKKTTKLQDQYFTKGVDTINSQLTIQENNFNTTINQKNTEIDLLRKQVELKSKEVELKTRETAELKEKHLVKKED